MSRFEHLILVCTTERPPDSKKGSCAARGSQQLLGRLRELVSAHGLKGRVRVTSSGCLDLCAKGCAAVALRAGPEAKDVPAAGDEAAQMAADAPAETWYTDLTPEDAEALFVQHVLHNRTLTPRQMPVRTVFARVRASQEG